MQQFVAADGRTLLKYNLQTPHQPPQGRLPPIVDLDHTAIQQRRQDWATTDVVSAGHTGLATLVDVLLLEARAAEPYITSLLLNLVLRVGGGARLIDLDHRFKTSASILSKLERFADRAHQSQRTEVEADIVRMHTTEPGKAGDPIVVDTLRYTVLVPTASYSEVARHIRRTLLSARMDLLDAKNFWHGEQLYRGINDCYQTATDVRTSHVRALFFEVQVHTAESIGLKHAIHTLHEQERECNDEAKSTELQMQMLAAARALQLPRHVLELPKKVVRPPWFKLRAAAGAIEAVGGIKRLSEAG